MSDEKRDNVTQLTQLGSRKTRYKYTDPRKDILETFPNQYPEREYIVEFVFREFTSLCPKTGQPDFGEIMVRYIPDEMCIETKSLKLYFLSFRQHGAFMETITNKILEDLVATCLPRQMTVIAKFNTRGGTNINVVAEYKKA